MTRLFPFLIMLSVTLASHGQNISITFSSKGALVQIDSITASNLATGQQVTLPGNDTLLLTPKTGIPSFEGVAAYGMIFPNPSSGHATILATVAEPQRIHVKVQNLAGEVVTQTEALAEQGQNRFNLTLSAAGIYLVSISTSQGTSAHKLISTGSSSGNLVQFLGSASNSPDIPLFPMQNPKLKAEQTDHSLGYSAGDTIRYRCRSGDFTATFTDSPMEPENYEVEFPPIASFTIDPAEGNTETSFRFNANASRDAETPAGELEFRWDPDGDGNWDTEYAMDPYCGFRFNWAGSYTVILEVRDAGGLTAVATIAVSIVNASEGTFTDPRDNNRYPYKTIGTQAWMTKNLAWLPEVSLPNVGSDTIPFYYVYGYSGSSTDEAKLTGNYKTYGVLYNATAARDACPRGWHTPSDGDWMVLEKFLGMSDADLYNPVNATRGSGNVGGKLKETGSDHWTGFNAGATNEVGFTALPGGYRWETGVFLDLHNYAVFYTSTPTDETHTWGRVIHYSLTSIGRFSSDRNENALSVRCLRD